MPLVSSSRLLYIAAGFFIILLFGFVGRAHREAVPWPTNYAAEHKDEHHEHIPLPSDHDDQHQPVLDVLPPVDTPPADPVSTPPSHTSAPAIVATSSQDAGLSPTKALWDADKYTLVSSKMTPDGKWFPIDFGDYGSYNPNLIPHPWKNDTWVMIAQGSQAPGDVQGAVYSLELVCDATYTNGKMKCLRSPTTLPIASTVSDHCTEDLDWFNYFIGPNDPRVFFGPDRPYITYGSASQYTCLGQWIHDLRRLVRWNGKEVLDRTQRFFWPTELQRPQPYGGVEKNWFAFWDHSGEMYLHYNIYPSRSYARLSHDGANITEDLAPLAASKDEACLREYMPKLGEKEHVHQATNSLAITMCPRASPDCESANDTYIFTIFHHKQFHESHNLYEPYIMAFHNTPPFGIYAISSKPFWINGRGKPGESTTDRPIDQSQMMYITSMSWKDQNMTYHGYMDDDLFINFGIEDSAAGSIDIVAGDLFTHLNLCQ